MNWQSANTDLHHRGHGNPMARRKVGNNTYLERREGNDIALRLHDTDVLTFHSDGSTTYDSGGWLTVTTKDRMNYASPRVYSDKRVWYVAPSYDGDIRCHRYFDGMTIAEKGDLLNPEDNPKWESIDGANSKAEKAIAGYLKGFTAEVAADLLAEWQNGPPTGDCFYCLMTTEGDSLGDATGDTSHLESHLDERYYMVSLLLNAFRDRNYADPAQSLSLHLSMGLVDNLRREMSRYLLKRLTNAVAV